MLKILLKALVLNQVIALSLLLAVTLSASLSKSKPFIWFCLCCAPTKNVFTQLINTLIFIMSRFHLPMEGRVVVERGYSRKQKDSWNRHEKREKNWLVRSKQKQKAIFSQKESNANLAFPAGLRGTNCDLRLLLEPSLRPLSYSLPHFYMPSATSPFITPSSQLSF